MSSKGSSFLTTFGLMSRIPSAYAGKTRFSGSLFYIPVIGLIVSGILFGIFAGLSVIVPDPFIVVLAVLVVQYLLFNLFHFDGYLDTADAFFCFAQREKRLSILKDSSVGAFALFFGTVYVGTKLYLLTKAGVYFYILGTDPLSRWALIFLFFSYPMSGRTAAALIPLLSKPAKNEGLGAAMGEAPPFTALLGLIVSHIPGAALYIAAYLLFSSVSLLFFFACGGAFLSFLVTASAYNRKAGGYTGDAFGFAIETGEILHIFIFYLLLTFGLG
jgi:adenosylcobinamide-GDP ribazoletransferase